MRKLTLNSGRLTGGGGPIRTALLLAAGMGSRLAPFTDDLPKCLVSVSGVPIIERLVRTLDDYGFERLVAVVGHRADSVRDFLGDGFGGVSVEYVVSPRFATTNSLYSLWLASRLVDGPFLLVESDIVFDAPLLAPLLQPDRIAVSPQLPWMSGTTVTLDARGAVSAFYSPPPGVYGRHCRAADHFITVNLTSLGRGAWAEARARLDRHVEAGHTGYFHDVVFAEMTAAGSMALEAVQFPADRWYEVDTPADRDAAELVFPRRLRAAEGSGPAEARAASPNATHIKNHSSRARSRTAARRRRPSPWCSWRRAASWSGATSEARSASTRGSGIARTGRCATMRGRSSKRLAGYQTKLPRVRWPFVVRTVADSRPLRTQRLRTDQAKATAGIEISGL